jgi:hypothetical protein
MIQFSELFEMYKIKFQNKELQLFMRQQSFIHMLQNLLKDKQYIEYPLYKQGWEQYIQHILYLTKQHKYTEIEKQLSKPIIYKDDTIEEGQYDAQQSIIQCINNVNNIYEST